MSRKYITSISLILFVVLASAVIVIKGRSSNSSSCQPITQSQALDIVRKIPEVKDFLANMVKARQPVAFIPNNVGKVWNVQIAEDHPDHLATFNWYTLDACTGKLKCSMEIYNSKGELIRASNENEYPCN